MWYAVIGVDAEQSLALRAKARTAHVGRLEQLRDQGRLLLAGPFPAIDSADPGEAGFSGSLVVAEFESLEAAQQWASEDPYIAVGAWRSADVKPFKKTLP